MRTVAKSIVINFMVIVLSVAYCHAQKNDYVWLSGYGHGYSQTSGLTFGTTILDFNHTPVNINYDSLSMNFAWTNTSFCDSNGNLLFYTNGAYVANSVGDSIENGDSLNWDYWMQYDDTQHGSEGYLAKEGIYALQSLTNQNQYYIIHSLIDSNSISGGAILYTLLDMSLNGGKGKVLYKNQILLNDKISSEFAITRHANGRYWWIVTQKKNTNCYYRMLLDETGPHLISDSVCAGTIYTLNDFGPMNFSQDGGKLLTLGVYAGLNVFDFDRCNGEISNPLTISYPYLGDSGWIGGGVATSPNSRYLYVCITNYLFQYDLWATDIAGSVDTVGYFDGFIAPFPSQFATAINGPDGKIYISCGNADTVYNVINNPDAKGALCNLVQHGIHVSRPSWGVPSFPNYRLGALPGGCDTTIGINELQTAKEQIIKVYPNPANTFAIIDYGFTDWSKGQPDLEICNALGQVVYQQALPMYSGIRQIDIRKFATGNYTVFIKRNNGVVAADKLLIAR